LSPKRPTNSGKTAKAVEGKSNLWTLFHKAKWPLKKYRVIKVEKLFT